jgi:hypothetical protein
MKSVTLVAWMLLAVLTSILGCAPVSTTPRLVAISIKPYDAGGALVLSPDDGDYAQFTAT